MNKYIVWHIQGGLGKNVAATGLPKTIKEVYSDRQLIMVVSYPEVFLNNPYVDRAGTLYSTMISSDSASAIAVDVAVAIDVAAVAVECGRG